MSALSTSPTRGDTSATTSTARLTTAITSSHSPSMLVNIALVSLGRPDSRTTRTAAATASVTEPVSSPDIGLMLNATIMLPSLVEPSPWSPSFFHLPGYVVAVRLGTAAARRPHSACGRLRSLVLGCGFILASGLSPSILEYGFEHVYDCHVS